MASIYSEIKGYCIYFYRLFMDVLRCDGYDMRILYGSQLYEVVHGFIANDKGRIAIRIVFAIRGVIVVIAQQGTRLEEVHVIVVEHCIDFFL